MRVPFWYQSRRGGEVKWVVNWANDRDRPIPCISQTVLMQYRDVDWPQAKAHALLRSQYGGHPIHKAVEAPPGAAKGGT